MTSYSSSGVTSSTKTETARPRRMFCSSLSSIGSDVTRSCGSSSMLSQRSSKMAGDVTSLPTLRCDVRESVDSMPLSTSLMVERCERRVAVSSTRVATAASYSRSTAASSKSAAGRAGAAVFDAGA